MKIDRWILASALQKSIRRGLKDEAIDVAVALHAVDAEYAWRRLRVIAFEDVGMGNVEAVASVAAIAGRQQLRGALGDLQVYVGRVQSLTAAVKDRTACDLLSWIGCAPESTGFRAAILSAPERWEAIAMDRDSPMWQRASALQFLAGFAERAGAGWRTVTRANPNAVKRVLDALEPHPLVAFSVLRGKGTESLNVALLFAHLMWRQANRRPLVSREAELQSPVRIGGVIAPSFCMYTRVGLRALRLFLHRDQELRGMLGRAGASDSFKTLGLLLFQVESGLLDRVEDYAPAVRVCSERAELAQFGVTDDAASAALRMLLREHLPILNCTRREAFKAYLTEMKSSGGSA
ncbi:MAG: hypothetical protein KGO02_16195 [Alphaproteobacteria bacterium]|nr:hypothetical protein [Alphaproteobacteria bacterium]